MRILLLTDINSEHSIKWANALAAEHHQVEVVSLTNSNIRTQKSLQPHIPVTSPPQSFPFNFYLLRFIYTFLILLVRAKDFKNGIVHAHYASSYGFLGSLLPIKNLVISVWGSDIYQFPRKGWIFRSFLKFNLSRAELITSSSKVMAEEAALYTGKEIFVVPFGINPDRFFPSPRVLFSQSPVTIGTIKTLAPIYGTDTLLEMFCLLKKKTPAPLQLLIAGGGDLDKYKQLAAELKIDSDVKFLGRIETAEVPIYHNLIDIFVSLSREESFGVSPIEAMYCERPVVLSEAPGHTEAVVNNKTGILVPINDPEAAAEAVFRLLNDPDHAKEMGRAARQSALTKYSLAENVKTMISLYEKVLRKD